MSPSPSQTESATPGAAIVLVLCACMLFSCLDTSAKYLVLSGMDAAFVAWVRFAAHLVLALILFRAWSNPRLFRLHSLPLQVVRGMFLFGSTAFNFFALKTLQLAETMSIAYFGPMVITALAGPLLGEWAGWRRWMAIGIGFVGVLVITRPGFGTFHIGHVFAICSMLSYCFYAIMTRHMSATETSESLIFYSALTPVVLMSPVVPYAASWPASGFHWIILLSLGVYGGVGHYLLIRAYRIATASALAPYPYSQMIWMIGFGYLVFAQFPDAWTLAGAAIIVASGLYIVYREHVLRLRSRTAPNSEAGELAKDL